jgi:hypothetical protein
VVTNEPSTKGPFVRFYVPDRQGPRTGVRPHARCHTRTMSELSVEDFTRLQNLTSITVQSVDGHLVIPAGMIPKCARLLGDDRWTVYVEGWTGEREHDSREFSLFPLLESNRVMIRTGQHGQTEDQAWYTFGEPTKRATKVNGELLHR